VALRPLLLLLCVSLAAGVLAPAAIGGRKVVACTAWASPAGDDLAAGSKDRPFRTVSRLVLALAPGGIGCLQPAAVFPEHVVVGAQGAGGHPVTLTTPSGARAIVGEGMEFLQSSRDVVVSHISFRMSGAEPFNSLPAVVQIGGFRNRFAANVEHGNHVEIDGNLIHECGVIGSNTGIYAPGIRVGTGVRSTITNNLIWNTPGDGIALAPNAQGVLVSRNLIDGTANGIFLSGDDRFRSNDNRISNNIITFVTGFAAHGSNPSGAPVGARNLVTRNCVWQPGRGLFAGSGFTAPANRVVDPGFLDHAAPFALRRTSPCWDDRPRP
jgi:Right handed beta helix region